MVAVFNGAGIKYSRDNGATWTNSNITAVILYDVKWGGSMFVAMGSNTSTSLYYSSNGTAWTAVNIGYMPNLLFYVGGVWFVNHVFGWVYSFDGINWVTFNVISGTGLSNSSSSSSLATLAVYGKGLYIVGTTLGIYYSSDGANWSQVTGGSAGNSIGAVIYENNIFVASGSSTISTGMYYSYDGINWTTAATTIGTVQSLGFANGLFIATSANTGANGFWTSTDANTWTRQTSGQVNVTAVQYVSSSACNLSYNVGFGTTSSNAFKEYHSGLIYSQGQMFQNNGAPVSSPANVTSTKAGTDRINAVTPYTLAQALPILTLNSGRIVVGNASNTPAGVVMSGDATITNAGVVTVGTTTPTLSTVAKWDAFTNLTANNLVNYIVSTVTSGGTITLAASSAGTQRFTGSTTHTAILPNATTLTNGTQYLIQNESSGGITIQTNGGGAFTTVPGNADVLLTLVSNGVAAGTWHAQPAAFTSALTSANIFVGNASNVATGVAVTGDITLSNTGVMRVASSAVGNGLTGGSGTVISVLPDTTTTNMAAVSVSANGAGVLTDGTSIVYAGGILSASVIDCGTF